MSGFCYITDGRESYYDIAAKFIKSTKKELTMDICYWMNNYSDINVKQERAV